MVASLVMTLNIGAYSMLSSDSNTSKTQKTDTSTTDRSAADPINRETYFVLG